MHAYDHDHEDLQLTCTYACKMSLKLDAVHTMMHIQKFWSKIHGAFTTLMSSFDDALFVSDSYNMYKFQALVNYLKLKGHSADHISKKEKKLPIFS